MSLLGDYLDSLHPHERTMFAEGPTALIPPAVPAPSLAPSPFVYRGPSTAPMVAPVSTVPVDAATWRRTVSSAALLLATQIATIIRAYPSSPVTTALFVNPLRAFGLVVIDPSRMTADGARSTLNGLATLLRGAAYVSAGGAAELRAGLDRVIAMIPAGTSTPTWSPTPTPPTGGGGGWTTPTGPETPPPTGGGSSPPPTSTSGCPTNASPVAGGCACNPGFAPDSTLTSCVPVAGGGYVPGPTSTASRGNAMGWLLLIGGAAFAYKALK